MRTPSPILSILLLVLAGCTSPKPGKLVVIPSQGVDVHDDFTDRVRYPELVKGYHVSRYVDPNHGLVMHETHTIYRVESQTTWNLHSAPGCFLLPSGTPALTNTAFVPPSVNDAVLAEVNRQRSMTRALQQQAETLNGSLQQFSEALANTRTLAEQNKALREQLANSERRLNALEAEINKPSSRPPPAADDK